MKFTFYERNVSRNVNINFSNVLFRLLCSQTYITANPAASETGDIELMESSLTDPLLLTD